jgi:hypothetical protein
MSRSSSILSGAAGGHRRALALSERLIVILGTNYWPAWKRNATHGEDLPDGSAFVTQCC